MEYTAACSLSLFLHCYNPVVSGSKSRALAEFPMVWLHLSLLVPSQSVSPPQVTTTYWVKGEKYIVCACVHACVSASTQLASSRELNGIQRPVHSTVWRAPWREEGPSNHSRGYSANLSRICFTPLQFPPMQCPQTLRRPLFAVLFTTVTVSRKSY